MIVKCECGHEFKLTASAVNAWSNECECCGQTTHVDITCPACYKTEVICEAA